ncbi:MAG: hypothetical protein AB7M12_09225 [Hyphomonadaceae bacterium]
MKAVAVPSDVRLLTRAQAKAYCGGRDPGAVAAPVALPDPLPGVKARPRWDRRALDAALDALGGFTPKGEQGDGLDPVRRKLGLA